MEKEQERIEQEVRFTEVFNAPIEKVWKAVSTAEGIAVWFMPNDFEPVEGHDFHLNAAQFGMSPCKVTKIDPPHFLSFNWGKDWFVEFYLKEMEGKTEFTLVHGGWDEDKVTEFGAPHRAVQENMAKGWAFSILPKLRSHIEG
ncbi:SRPBCC family protein [Falsibacillus pallidus]|uniref:Uncharacterized protein YndB with AHSA1/START domain n=1 Tax=Falsibacillus pallidus TaxID=493781 RepID=A0A370GPZ2_9BACI|nr:SRPBCC domain-containing protein [Falsibacillus pallidus]RDI45449.1 uncharacterized protein YndB with AHSA1/START domain [Falsibacillus pallidus]